MKKVGILIIVFVLFLAPNVSVAATGKDFVEKTTVEGDETKESNIEESNSQLEDNNTVITESDEQENNKPQNIHDDSDTDTEVTDVEEQETDDVNSSTEYKGITEEGVKTEVENEETDEKKELNEESDPVEEVDKSKKTEDEIYEEKQDVDEVYKDSSNEDEQRNVTILSTINESSTSKLGHLNNSDVLIYQDIGDESSTKAGKNYIGAVYYIKKQAEMDGQVYYLISEQASSERGVIGWVKAEDLSTHDHKGVDTKSKTFYIKGTGNAYSKAWGGSEDHVFDLSNYKGKQFNVHKTEKVGKNTWYRGDFEGERVFIHSAYLTNETANQIEERKISKLGHLKNNDVVIYQEIGNESSIRSAKDYINFVYYIKKQAEVDGQIYYLISEQASSERGVIGWVKAEDLSTHDHKGVDTKSKTFYIKGTGNAYSKAWGGSEDHVFDLSNHEGKQFNVHKTERVGKNTWYRGDFEGERVFIHSAYLTTEIGSSTSKLGQLKSSNVLIYKEIGDATSSVPANDYTEAVYYIKKQAETSEQVYYLISEKASSERGVIGWVKAEDISTHNHVGIDTKSKTFIVKGTGNAYSKAWGGSKDLVYDLSKYEESEFKVNKTERVGNNTWYRGDLDGERVFIHSAYLEVKSASNTSKLGHLKSSDVLIYQSIIDEYSADKPSSEHMNKVYYIKKQAEYEKQLYYLISNQASSERGIVGWVKAEDLSTHDHVGVDSKSKTLYIKGTGNAYRKAWGGNKDLVYDLFAYEGLEFQVNKTEKVGNNTWYRGILDGEEVFIHTAYLTTKSENSTSKLAHFNNSNVIIYESIGNIDTSEKAGSKYMDSVYYIKKQAKVNNQVYYLVSDQPSSRNGIIGWVKAEDLSIHNHVGVDTNSKVFYTIGTGNAYDRAWGGKENLVYNLSEHAEERFQVNKTEKVGNNTWYRGILNNKEVWIHEAYLDTSTISYQNFDISLEEALDIQMNQLQQTDKYRNETAYIHSDKVEITRTDKITGDGVNLRTAPNFNNNVKYNVGIGTAIKILDEVTGAEHKGSTKWYKLSYKDSTLYVHTSLAQKGAKSFKTTDNIEVRAKNSKSAHVYGVLSEGSTVNVVDEKGEWYEITYTTWRNPTRDDVRYYMNPDNNDIFQHLVLSESIGVNANSLNTLLNGKGILNKRGQEFIDAAVTHKVNEIYLISHALHETGNGTSSLATGIEVGLNKSGDPVLVTSKNRNSLTDIETVHNMYGIDAVDGDAHRGGAIRAYEEEWFTPKDAIIGGAKFIGEDYIHNSYNQDTLYKMRWNPASPGYPQYATDIAWATKQIANIKTMYEMIDNPLLKFNVIQYR
ncbi:N-acetylglucosaminidase [Oceanobacillus halophilus]|uniref:Mannosyl-glycoprotein endo-beta-N-acetylglucosamidase n=1 Tax=Oceanobacillus halophilus TaxID=930130 RepID=A0A495A4H5_9BACI|nr:GW dipeptide domain-containing protein [Oceanobacillus halophilus]RKQ34312.1 hypothetical protein D8M06_08005 [Oceanobacillus halophilus]